MHTDYVLDIPYASPLYLTWKAVLNWNLNDLTWRNGPDTDSELCRPDRVLSTLHKSFYYTIWRQWYRRSFFQWMYITVYWESVGLASETDVHSPKISAEFVQTLHRQKTLSITIEIYLLLKIYPTLSSFHFRINQSSRYCVILDVGQWRYVTRLNTFRAIKHWHAIVPLSSAL